LKPYKRTEYTPPNQKEGSLYFQATTLSARALTTT